jgi:membrane-associated protein
MLDTQELLNALKDAYAAWGYPIVFLGSLLENTVLLGLLLPGGALVILGATYAQQGTMSLPVVLLLAVLGTIAGTSLDYALGRLGLHSLLKGTSVERSLSTHLEKARVYLDRYGAWAFLLAHFVGHIRSFVAITAGITTLPVRRFLLYESMAALAWNVLFVGAGYFLGTKLGQVQSYAGGAGLTVVVLLGLAWVGYRLSRRMRSAPAALPSDDPGTSRP